MRERQSLETTLQIARPTGGTADVLLVAGPGHMGTYPPSSAEMVIGRSSACDVVIDHRALSRRHAVLRFAPRLTIQDLGSTNGTRRGSDLLVGGDPVPLELGESFHIGPFSFIVVPRRADDVSTASFPGGARLVVDDPTADGISDLAGDIARSDISVLILGETGVGKDVLASTLHAASGRTGPLCRINCAALSESLLESELFGHEKGAFTGAVNARAGHLESAAGGTVFLDEIGELPLTIQAKLLRAVEAREILRLGSTRATPIDVRFIAATHRDLPAEVSAGRFRHDLYFRLDGVTLHVPPLRERAGVIARLALGFIEDAGRRSGRPVLASARLVAALESYDWPGNVRELKAVIDRAVLLAAGGELAVHHLTFAPRSAPPAADRRPAKPARAGDPDDAVELSFLSVEQREDRERIVDALRRCVGNQTRAAKLLGIARSTLVSKIALYRLPRPRT